MSPARTRARFGLPRSLVWRVGVALIAVQAAVALIILWQGYRQLLTFHLEEAMDKLARLDPLLSARYSDPLQESDWPGLDSMVKVDGPRIRARITVILSDGRVVADSESDPAAMENHRSRPEVTAALSAGQGVARRISDTTGIETLYRAERITLAGGESAVIRSALPLSAVRAEFWSQARVLGGIFIAVMTATLLLFLLISRAVARQVGEISRGAARFAAGQLEHRIREPSASELASLARSLNDMARQLQQRLREVNARQEELRTILQSMTSGVLALDGEQRILAMNRSAEALLGVTAAAAHGRLLHEVIRQPELHRLAAAALRGGDQSTDQAPIEFALAGAVSPLGAGGGEGGIRIEARAERLQSSDDRGRERRPSEAHPTGLLLLLNDVTRLRRLESLRSDFAANVSHELRTPITNIKGYVETLLETGLGDREQAERFLTVIRHNSDRLAAIVEDVLALTRLERASAGGAAQRDPAAAARGSVEFPKERAPIRGILAAAIAQHQAAADAKSMTVELAADADLTARVHSALLEQAVSNLISNAINYSPPRTTVRVSAGRLASGEIEIAVTDEGPGIAREHQERIFERFYRIDRGRSREVGGTGLGLAIVKHIAIEHGGTCSLESDVGKGATFRIVLPGEPAGSRDSRAPSEE